MSVAFQLPRSTRRSDYVAVADQRIFGPTPWLGFDPEDVRVRTRVTGGRWATMPATDYTTFMLGPDYVVVTLAIGRSAGDFVRVEGARVHARVTDVTRAGAVKRELDKMATVLQELRRDIDELTTRAVQSPEGESGFDLLAVAARANGAQGYDALGRPVKLPITGVSIGVPDPGTVGPTQLAPNAVTSAAVSAGAILLAGLADNLAMVSFPNRATLAAYTPRKQSTAVIWNEGGRNGVFVWSGANFATKVTNDPGQGVYVPPAGDVTGASGAWVRQRQLRTYDVEWFGCATSSADNYQAVTNCITLAKHEGGGTILVPQFYQTATLIVFDGADLNVVGTSRSAGFYRTTAGATVEFTGQRHRATDLLIAMQVLTLTATDFALWVHNCVECHFERIRVSGGYNCISITGGGCTGNTFHKCSLSFATGPAMLALADSTGGVNGAHHFYACELNQGYPVSFPNGTTTFKGARANSTAYAVGDIVVVGQFNLQCRVAGTSAASAPAVTVWYGTDISDGLTLKWQIVGNANYRGIDVGTNIYYSVWRECDLTGPFLSCIHVRNQFAMDEPNTLLFDHCTTHGPISIAYYLEAGSDILITNPNGWNAFDNLAATYGILNVGCRDVRVTNATLYGFDVGASIQFGGTDISGGAITGCTTAGVEVTAGILGWSVQGVNLGFSTLGGANANAMTIAAGCDRFNVTDNRTYGAGAGITNSAGTGATKVVSGNIG
jgi:hypothetical protein